MINIPIDPFLGGLNGDDFFPNHEEIDDADFESIFPQSTDSKMSKFIAPQTTQNKKSRISKSDLENKTGEIIKGDLIKKSNNNAVGKDIITFGKYKGKTKQYVKEFDLQYWQWAKDNVKGF